ncbi:SDR family oxidoreductase [soil metagenome]
MSLEGKTCVVTGASSGVGHALTVAFVRAGAQVWAIGRDRERLESIAGDAAAGSGASRPLVVDLQQDDELESACREILAQGGGIDVLAHAAGVISRGPVESAAVEDLDSQYRVNLRAPFVLTRILLPALKQARGQVVFMNSSRGGAAPSPDAALYAATKRGLAAFADGLRQEVNTDGVRVLTVYLGRTATPMQESVHEHEGRIYRPELLLRPEDVVEIVLASISLRPTAEVTEVSLRPAAKLPDARA